jgi:Flp pilus assembly pilin Flp
MNEAIKRFVRQDAWQDLIEYGLLVGIITVAVIIAIGPIGGKATNYFFTALQGELP